MPAQKPVLIVGGGPVGLSASVLLSRLGIPSYLIERDFDTADHPQARSLNIRTNEIYRLWGIEEELREVSLPPEWSRQIVYTRTLAGEELGRMRSKATGTRRIYSPAPYFLSGQDRFEPILRRCAESYPGAVLRFGAELLELDVDDSGVTATLRDRSLDRTESLRADYAIAADGVTSTLRRSRGIEMIGERNLATSVSTYFRADLSRYVDHRPGGLFWVASPEARGVFQPIDGRDLWLCQIGFTDSDRPVDRDLHHDEARAWIHAAVGDDRVPIEVLNTKHWTMGACFAERFREGPVFLAGDAAHQLPITGGFGLNTGVQDVHNLAWKLAFVIRGLASPDLLDSYEAERRPAAEWLAARSLDNYRAAMRVTEAALETLGGETRDNTRESVQKTQRYGNWMGMDLGIAYSEGALVPDGSAAPTVDDPVQQYAPTGRPGHRAPHVVLSRSDRLGSTLDFFETRFTLLCGSRGKAWLAAAEKLGADLPCRGIGVDTEDGYRDDEGSFCELYGIEEDGAVWVRPDGHVAWRSVREAADPLGTLEGARRRVLGG